MFDILSRQSKTSSMLGTGQGDVLASLTISLALDGACKSAVKIFFLGQSSLRSVLPNLANYHEFGYFLHQFAGAVKTSQNFVLTRFKTSF